MKKLLAFLLIFCLMITSVFSVPVLAEETGAETDEEVIRQSKNPVILESNFGSGTTWSARGTVNLRDEDGDNVKEVARLTSSSTKTVALKSSSFALIPGDDYELTYYLRVPNTSGAFYTESKNHYPRVVFYQPTVTEVGVSVADNYSPGNNEYAYNKARRKAFVANWKIGEYDAFAREKYSVFDTQHDEITGGKSPNEVYADWTKVTISFKALDDEANGAVGNQITALYFTFDNNKEIDGLILDIKDVALVNKTKEAAMPTKGLYFKQDFETITDLAGVIETSSVGDLSITDTYSVSGEKSAKIYALYQWLYMPIDTSVLVENTQYNFSFSWKMNNYTEEKQRHIKNVYLIGWDPSTGQTLKQAKDTGKIAGSSSKINATGGWITTTFSFKITDFTKYEKFVVSFVPCSSEPYKSSEDSIYIDDILITDDTYVPEEPEVPEEEEETIAEVPYVLVVDTEGNQHKSGVDIGAKVDLNDNADGTTTFALTYDEMDNVNIFKGWYDGETLLSDELTYTAPDTVNKENVKAKILCRSVISGGLGFEGYTEAITSLHVHPDDANGNLHDVAPHSDKWGQIYDSSYQKQSDFLMVMNAVNGQTTVKNKTSYANREFSTGYVAVTPYSGSSMLDIASVEGRGFVRKLDNLKPNTNYELSFYVYNTSDWVFLNTATISDSYYLPNGATSSKDYKVYNYYKAKTTTNNSYEHKYGTTNNGAKAVKDLAQTWHKISISFTTDSDDTELYLRFSLETAGDTKNASNHIFIDNLTCTEAFLGYTGNAIRETDSALRYKFYVDNDMLQGFAGMTTKKVGVLAVKSEILGDEALEIGKSFAKDVEVKEENLVTDSTDSSNKYFTVALYNIGKIGEKMDYSRYGSDYSLRPYIVFEDEKGEEKVFYGETVDASIFKVMLAIFGDNKDENDLALANSILEKEGVSKAYDNWQPTDGWYFGEHKANTDYAYSFAVVGDTQKTTGYYPDKLHYTYDWIINNAEDKNIQYVLGLGDITESKNEDKEWPIAITQLDRLQQAGINQSIVRGNHDDEPYFDEFITKEKYGNNITDSFDETMRNTYRLITINGINYMIFTLDLYPSDDVLSWAGALIEEHSNYNVIITTHSYFDHDMSYDTDGSDEQHNSGTDILNDLVSKHSNIVLVLCGHRYAPEYGPNYIVLEREDGSKVMQMMVNPQKFEADADRSLGMLAMLYFSNDGRNVSLEYFSTINGMFYKDKFQFDFTLDLVD